jgi:chromate reductase, NAD(P)H dehydrogenase (quinone)
MMRTGNEMKILAISGSLRAASSNTALLQTIAHAMDPRAEMHLFGALGILPPFDPDIDEAAPPIITAFRATMAAADAVAISTPEYAHGVPGVLKNALDWLVGSGELYQKPVVLLHVSTRGEYARASLREILTTMGAKIILEALARKPSEGLAAYPDDALPAIDIDTIAKKMIGLIQEPVAP